MNFLYLWIFIFFLLSLINECPVLGLSFTNEALNLGPLCVVFIKFITVCSIFQIIRNAHAHYWGQTIFESFRHWLSLDLSGTDLLKHVLPEVQLLHQALAAVLQIHAQQSFIWQLLLSRAQAALQLNTNTLHHWLTHTHTHIVGNVNGNMYTGKSWNNRPSEVTGIVKIIWLFCRVRFCADVGDVCHLIQYT